MIVHAEWVRLLRRNTMQGLKVLATIVDEIAKVDTKFVKVTEVENLGLGHRVKVHADWGCQGETLYKVWRFYQLYLMKSQGSMKLLTDGWTDAWMGNQTPLSHHASRYDKNVSCSLRFKNTLLVCLHMENDLLIHVYVTSINSDQHLYLLFGQQWLLIIS